MDFDHYDADQFSEFSYRFYSTGPRGVFKLHVRFTYLGYDMYNLGFGVVDLAFARLDDRIELRNGDREKILATVANITLDFIEKHPKACIYASGSTPSRTRLYQMGINRILPELERYEIVGLIPDSEPGDMQDNYLSLKGKWHKVRMGASYNAFLLFDPSMTNLDQLSSI